MERLRKNILPQMPSNLFHNVPGGVKLLHINIGNLKTKIPDIKNDDIFHNADIIVLNETHLQHTDTLTPNTIGLSQDRLIVCCDRNTRGGGVALVINRNLKSQTYQNGNNFGNCCCTETCTNANNCNISLKTTINTT